MLTEFSHFMIAGMQKSGTTFCSEMLDRHPEIAMAQPIEPEPKYFLPDRRQSYSKDEYRELFFKDRGNARILGEKSVSYSIVEGSAELIQKHLPDAKFIFVLRDPVLRAVSNYNYSVNNGLEKRSLEEAFRELKDREAGLEARHLSAPPYAYLVRGHYVQLLERFEKVFGLKKLFILIQEPWIKDGMPLGKLLDFVGADPSYEAEIKKNLNWHPTLFKEDLPEELSRRLAHYFEPFNKELADRYEKLDLSLWIHP